MITYQRVKIFAQVQNNGKNNAKFWRKFEGASLRDLKRDLERDLKNILSAVVTIKKAANRLETNDRKIIGIVFVITNKSYC